jgi:hypothetical protein
VLLLLAIIAIAYLLYRRVLQMPPHRRRGEMLKILLGLIVAGVFLLTLSGKMHWLGAAFTGLLLVLRQYLPLLIRLFPMVTRWRQAHAAGATGSNGSRHSTVSTASLSMHLDHDSGALWGEVLAGPFRDWRLEEMDREQLEQLRAWCAREDAESVQLLDSYLEQRFPGQTFGQSAEEPPQEPADGSMGRAEALRVLGLGEQASKEDVVAAHRKLMQKLHPDRGGNDYLAAKVNEAKDVLLG